ncbi:MAG: hypothetical protein KF850_27170 [Labilithrix sp.]|nr:hypothetical protein [Labilithrix sp.]MBX3215749.1 hypothetical protein [Labilithrix sp.]
MKFASPDGITVSSMSVRPSGQAYLLTHPVAEGGPPEMDTSIIFEADQSAARVLRVFETEITGICWSGSRLYVVDADSKVHEHDGSGWSDFAGKRKRTGRINDLRFLGERLYGIGDHNLIYLWNGSAWEALTNEVQGNYLYDLALDDAGRMLVAGQRGLVGEVVAGAIVPYETPVDTDITCVLPIGAGRFVATGARATILVGARDDLTEVDTGDRTLSCATAVPYEGEILVSAGREILRLDGSQAEVWQPTRALRLEERGGHLWKIDARGAAKLFRGEWRYPELVADI